MEQTHPYLQAIDIDELRARPQVVESTRPSRCAEAIQVANVADKRKAIAQCESAGIQAERDLLFDAAQPRMYDLQRCRQAFEIVRHSRVADVQVPRDGWRSPDACRDTTDDDEVDSVRDQELKSRDRIESSLAHRFVDRRRRSSPRAS